MSIPFGAAALSLPKPSLDLSSSRVSNPFSLPIPRLPIATIDRHHPLTIRMGGGPRTYPGGVSKWQWKRMQAKKAKQLLKARLCRERQLYEMRKRAELQAAVAELERPWEVVERAPALFSVKADEQVKALADRFQRPGGYDLWTERDGPQLFRSPVDGLPSARFFPKGVVHSVRPYGRIAGNSEDAKELPSLPPPAGSVAEAGAGESIESGRRRGMRSRRSSNWRRRGGSFEDVKGKTGDAELLINSMNNVEQKEDLGVLDSNTRADGGMKGRRGLYDDRNRRSAAGANAEQGSDFEGGLIRGERFGGSYGRNGSSGIRGRGYRNQQRHATEELYGSDSERGTIGGEESGGLSSVSRGRHNGGNRRFTAERFRNSSQRDGSRRIASMGGGDFKNWQ